MTAYNLQAEPLSRDTFAAFGDVIETDGAKHFAMNDGLLERYYDLAKIDIGSVSGGRVVLSIAEPNRLTSLPYIFSLIERHPLASQAFIPLGRARMFVVVAPPGEKVATQDLRAFVSNGLQGVNYHPGVWHLPLIVFNDRDRFLIVDRGGKAHNCDVLTLDRPASILPIVGEK